MFVIVCAIVGFGITNIITRVLSVAVTKTSSTLDDNLLNAIRNPLSWAVFFIILKLLASHSLSLYLTIAISLSVIWGTYKISDVFAQSLINYTQHKSDTLNTQIISIIHKISRTLILVLGALFIIQTMGHNVMSILAGLGLGGLAFALAAKDTCANLFGSINILIDQPFKIGDYIRVNQTEGTVEDVGLRSTRIRTFYDSQISIPNAEIANSIIDNNGRRKYRRIKTTLGVTYNTPVDKLDEFIQRIKEIIQKSESTRKDYFHVVFNEYGSSSLNILLYFFLNVDSYQTELIEKEKINFKILRLAKELSVSFAFPTQSIYIETNECNEEKL